MSESLRDTVANAFDSVVETPATVDNTADTVVNDSAQVDKPDRARDEQGRFTAKDSAPAPKNKGETSSSPSAPPAITAPVAEPAKPRYQRPSTWRKETWGVWDKLNANQPLSPEELDLFAQEAIKRDADFANGVSTYKREWESAKPLIDAMSPFLPLLQQYGIQPGQWIQNLGNAHRLLALGSPQEKAARFVQLAQEYGVPLEQLFQVGQDGRLYINQQFQAQAQAQQPQGMRPEQIQALIDERLTQRWADDELSRFAAQKEQHPHYEEVKQTMLGLLQAGLADDLQGAYEAALRHPRHSALYEAMQQQQRQADEQAKAEAARKAAEAARKKLASPRTATPTSASGAASEKKGLRDQIAANVDAVMGGRV